MDDWREAIRMSKQSKATTIGTVMSLTLFSSIVGSPPAVASDPVKKSEITATSQEPLTFSFQPTNPDAKVILKILEEMATACIHQNIETIAKHMHDDVTSINERTKVVLSGKEKVIEHIEAVFKQYSPEGTTPLISYRISQPFIHVHGKEAIATYTGIAKIGGLHPTELRSRISEVFVKDSDSWKSIHYKSRWDHEKVLNKSEEEESNPTEDRFQSSDFEQLKGGVKVLILNLQDIRVLGHDLWIAGRAVKELERESDRKMLTVNAVSNEIEPIISPDQSEFIEPRKKYLDHYCNEIETILNSLNKAVDQYEDGALNLVVEAKIKDSVKAILNDFISSTRQARKHLTSLTRLTKSPPYDNEAILRIISLLSADIEKMNAEQKALIKAFKKSDSR